jgi:hypothetical protein
MPKIELARFPVEKMVPRPGRIGGFLFENPHIKLARTLFHTISIPLERMKAVDVDGDEHVIDTDLRLDFIQLPGKPFGGYRALVGRVLDFPTNPSPGYIDASVYVLGAHNQMDVTRLEFLSFKEHATTVRLHAAIDFESERTGFENTRPFVIDAQLRIGEIYIHQEILDVRRIANAPGLLAEFADSKVLGKPVAKGKSVVVPLEEPGA